MSNRLPLEGVRVLDMTVVWAGPYCTTLLADLGAEVIRVESIQVFGPPTRGSSARPPQFVIENLPPFIGGMPNREGGARPWNRYPLFNAHARNKLSMTVDLLRPEGKQIFNRMVAISDVLVENNPTETMQKLGISYDELKQINPAFIMLANARIRQYRAVPEPPLAGHPHRGSHRTQPAERLYRPRPVRKHAGLYGGRGGGSGRSVRGRLRPEPSPPHRRGPAYGAIPGGERGPVPGTGVHGLLYERSQPDDAGQQASLPLIQGVYPCKGDDRWIAITIFDDRDWELFREAIGGPEWARESPVRHPRVQA